MKDCEKGQNCLKGDSFFNRYRIQGILTTRSPFHLGNGYVTERKGLTAEKNGQKESVEISSIVTDHMGKPVIPGSSLKGALRNYLLDVFSVSHQGLLARDRNFEELIRKDENLRKQNAQTDFMKEKASVLERLFGTPFAEGKIEVWNGECISKSPEIHPGIRNPEKPPFWDSQRMTWVEQSVAIDPETGTAIDKKLYHFEAVPPGVSFRINISGQNLVHAEMGMLLFGLYAFNSQIWPLTLGAMSGRGFGRFDFQPEHVYCLPKSRVENWIQEALRADHAGYASLKPLPETELKQYVADFKNMFLQIMGEGI